MSIAADSRGHGPLGFLFSPASSYPMPAAYVVGRDGTILHRWSHAAGQPLPEDDPPSYLRGWNHVEMDNAANLFAVVPLQSLLKLSHSSALEWSCEIAAHHDLAIGADGTIRALTEAPRLVETSASSHVILDNLITTISADGKVSAEASLWDLLRTNTGLRQRIDHALLRRTTAFRRRGWPSHTDTVPDQLVDETLTILQTGAYRGERRRALQLLRGLPGSPCDVLHTNTLELLTAHPLGLWAEGSFLVCMREINTIAVIDPSIGEVRWWWGPGELSGPHQPTMLADGRIVTFDNGRDQARTRILIVDPVSDRVVWSWAAQPPESFFCPLAGGCEPLPNGNLLVTNSTAGAAFELTQDGQTVWQLTLPVAVFGADRGRVSIYRMSAVDSRILPSQSQHLSAGTPVELLSATGRGR